MTYSYFENLIVIMIKLVQIEPYVMILLLSRLLSFAWFYTLDFQWRSFFLNFFSFCMVNNIFRSFKKIYSCGEKCPLIHSCLKNSLMKENWKRHLTSDNTSWSALHSMDEVTVCHWVIRGNKFLFWNTCRSCISLRISVVILLTEGMIFLLLLFVLKLINFFHHSLAIYFIHY